MTAAKHAARRPRRAYHHGNLRRALIDEALATIRAEGVDGLTLREIGARVGVSRTALYRHFADKRALLTAVAIEGFRALRERLVAAWGGGDRGDASLRAMGAEYVRFAVENPSHYRVMFGGFVAEAARDVAPDAGLTAEGEGTFQALVDALAALQRAGVVRGDDPVLAARYVWSVVHGVAMLAIDGMLPEPGALDALLPYALDRLRTGIAR